MLVFYALIAAAALGGYVAYAQWQQSKLKANSNLKPTGDWGAPFPSWAQSIVTSGQYERLRPAAAAAAASFATSEHLIDGGLSADLKLHGYWRPKPNQDNNRDNSNSVSDDNSINSDNASVSAHSTDSSEQKQSADSHSQPPAAGDAKCSLLAIVEFRSSTATAGSDNHNSGHSRDSSSSSSSGGPRICGHRGVVHGGLSCALLDQTLGAAVYEHCGGAAFTASLTVDFRAPLLAKQQFALLTVDIAREEGRKLWVDGRLSDGDSGRVFAEAKALFVRPKEAAAKSS